MDGSLDRNWPKVSVVITTYKGVDSVEKSIISAINQTYPNLEILVIDDNGLGTTEQKETCKLLQKFADRIIYIPHEKNMNGSTARNTGIRSATGKYVALLDDDDRFTNNKIELQVKKIEESEESALCYTGMRVHYSKGKSKDILNIYNGYVFADAMLGKVDAQTSCLLFNREKALKIGGFDESFRRHQDWEFFQRMAYHYSICAVPEICVDRYILQRTAASTPEKYEKNRLYYMEKMKPYIERLNRKEQKEFYDSHYVDMCKAYLKKKKIRKALFFLIKDGHILSKIVRIINDFKNSTYV